MNDTDRTRILAAARIARTLYSRRQNLGITQEEVAARANITVITYGSLERGWNPSGAPANPTLSTLIKVMDVLGHFDPTICCQESSGVCDGH